MIPSETRHPGFGRVRGTGCPEKVPGRAGAGRPRKRLLCGDLFGRRHRSRARHRRERLGYDGCDQYFNRAQEPRPTRSRLRRAYRAGADGRPAGCLGIGLPGRRLGTSRPVRFVRRLGSGHLSTTTRSEGSQPSSESLLPGTRYTPTLLRNPDGDVRPAGGRRASSSAGSSESINALRLRPGGVPQPHWWGETEQPCRSRHPMVGRPFAGR